MEGRQGAKGHQVSPRHHHNEARRGKLRRVFHSSERVGLHPIPLIPCPTSHLSPTGVGPAGCPPQFAANQPNRPDHGLGCPSCFIGAARNSLWRFYRPYDGAKCQCPCKRPSANREGVRLCGSEFPKASVMKKPAPGKSTDTETRMAEHAESSRRALLDRSKTPTQHAAARRVIRMVESWLNSRPGQPKVPYTVTPLILPERYYAEGLTRTERLIIEMETTRDDPSVPDGERKSAVTLLEILRKPHPGIDQPPETEGGTPKPKMEADDCDFDQAERIARSRGATGPFNTFLAVPFFLICQFVGETLASIFFKGAGGLSTLTAAVLSVGGYLYFARANERFYASVFAARAAIQGKDFPQVTHRKGWLARMGLPAIPEGDKEAFWLILVVFVLAPLAYSLAGGSE